MLQGRGCYDNVDVEVPVLFCEKQHAFSATLSPTRPGGPGPLPRFPSSVSKIEPLHSSFALSCKLLTKRSAEQRGASRRESMLASPAAWHAFYSLPRTLSPALPSPDYSRATEDSAKLSLSNKPLSSPDAVPCFLLGRELSFIFHNIPLLDTTPAPVMTDAGAVLINCGHGCPVFTLPEIQYLQLFYSAEQLGVSLRRK